MAQAIARGIIGEVGLSEERRLLLGHWQSCPSGEHSVPHLRPACSDRRKGKEKAATVKRERRWAEATSSGISVETGGMRTSRCSEAEGGHGGAARPPEPRRVRGRRQQEDERMIPRIFLEREEVALDGGGFMLLRIGRLR